MGQRDEDGVVLITGLWQTESDKSVCLKIDDGDVWLPFSQIRSPAPVRQPKRGDKVSLEVTAWIAQQKGLEGVPLDPAARPEESLEAGRLRRLEDEIRTLRARVTALEGAVRGAPETGGRAPARPARAAAASAEDTVVPL